MKKKPKQPKQQNFVAKYAREFNKAVVHRDKKNDYTRKRKHKNKEYDTVTGNYLLVV